MKNRRAMKTQLEPGHKTLIFADPDAACASEFGYTMQIAELTGQLAGRFTNPAKAFAAVYPFHAHSLGDAEVYVLAMEPTACQTTISSLPNPSLKATPTR